MQGEESHETATEPILTEASPAQLRAEIQRLSGELADAHRQLAEERRRLLLQSAPDPARVVYELSDVGRQELAREIWRERQRWSLMFKFRNWLKARSFR